MNISVFSDDPVMNLSVGIFLVLFSFLLFLSGTHLLALFRRERRWPRKDEPVTVIIPAYNEEKNIGRCLRSVLDSDYEKMQVIVVDDQSADRTAEIVKKMIADNTSADICLIRGSHKGKSASLNSGIAKSKYRYILTVDADVIVEQDTIAKMVAPLQDGRVSATNCIAVIRDPKGLIEEYQRIEFFLNNLIRVSFSRVFGNSIWFFGAVACYKRDVLEKIGYFKKDTLTEDMDICLEMYLARYKVVTVADAVISTRACGTLKGLFAQRMRWYFGALQSLVKNRRLLRLQKGSPSVLFLFFNQFWWTFFSFIFLPIIIYQVSYWWPGQGFYGNLLYLIRWFSLWGPFYVLYKIPEWGISLLNIFGVLSGIITLLLTASALRMFSGRPRLMTAIAVVFYFPYTIVINLIIVSGVIKYLRSKKKYFS
ncbi:MAG: glycosyltransferase [archaeon]